ncbi:hypothetical protein [Pseudochelatococcus sp. G4_1912]|uniref:hypothetical protein n=1 Tax=Pseudochelatococcus sp. G4_1912 TaxID=3114288 RepID=UPI0039C6FDC1
MQVTSAKYTESGFIIATVDGDEMSIPDDMENRHRVAIEAWGGVIEPYQEPEVQLAALKITLKERIDVEAEAQRGKYITLGAGQAMIYQAKAAEAIKISMLDEDAPINAGDYPLLVTEVGITAPTIREVGAVVLTLHEQWIVAGAAIEGVRLSAKAEIDAAQNEADARAVRPLWPQIAMT